MTSPRRFSPLVPVFALWSAASILAACDTGLIYDAGIGLNWLADDNYLDRLTTTILAG